MPIELVYLAALLITICIFFIVLKRPIYEGMLAGFIVMLAMTNQWSHAWEFVYKTSTNTLFYAIVAFMVVAQIFTGTKVIDACVEAVSYTHLSRQFKKLTAMTPSEYATSIRLLSEKPS